MAYTTIDDPTAFFQTVTYTGNGATGRSITLPSDTDMQPDWVWLKSRGEAEHHQLTDSVRGVNKQLYSHLSYGEASETDRITAFNSDGFTIEDDIIVNKNTIEFVAWCWKAGTSFSNDASSTSVGSIDSAGSVNDTAGFSIVSFVGTQSNGTIKHGLSSAPSMIILKSRDSSSHWLTGWTALGWTHAIKLNLTSAKETTHYYFNDTAPTSSVFSVGAGTESNKSGDDMIAYCFAEKKGYSKFGSYTGNGNANGTFLYTGFKPAWVMIKYTDSASDWYIYNNKINPFNVMSKVFAANLANAEITTSRLMDFTSNGFKNRGSGTTTNASGGNYIYMAFAENPFVTSTGVPATAR